MTAFLGTLFALLVSTPSFADASPPTTTTTRPTTSPTTAPTTAPITAETAIATDRPLILVAVPVLAGEPGLAAGLVTQLNALAGGRALAQLDGAPSVAAPFEAKDIRAKAEALGAAYLLVAHWHGPNAEGSVASPPTADLELRSGHSGATEHRYVLSLNEASPEGMAVDAEVRELASALLADLGLLASEPAPAHVSASGPRLSNGVPEPAAEKGKRTDFLQVSRDLPIEINSEALELVAKGKAKHLIFTDQVRVVQGDMRLFAEHLEAYYPEGAKQPNRLDARDNVRVIEGDLEVHCLEATYLRDDERVICRGNALLVQGCDEVRGQRIEFDLVDERITVTGAASVVLRLDEDDTTNCERRGDG
jgi:lipopolysaccharide transport protein LptA